MNILLIGSGGREHAFAQALSASKHCSHLYIAPGNAGTIQNGTNINIDINNFIEVHRLCIDKNIALVVVGPEEVLVNGICNYFKTQQDLLHIKFIGPDKAGAAIEGSKDWSKAFMKKYNIPTAAYQTFTSNNIQEGIQYISKHPMPVVLKADGLAAGKGVLICTNKNEAIQELQLMINENKFGKASSKVVVEEFLDGIELSVFVLCDGKNYKILPTAKDYKRIGEGDTGLNTGGMGAISPVPFADDTFMQKVEQQIIIPTINGLINEGINYIGFIFIGLIKVANQPLVIEYNCRMGDPETETVLPRIKTDMVELMMAAANGTLNNIKLDIDTRHTATVMLVSEGYPLAYQKDKTITGFDKITNSIAFHAGTICDKNNENIISNGGRVIAITSFGNSLKEAVAQSMQSAENINYQGKYYRKDIGYEFL